MSTAPEMYTSSVEYGGDVVGQYMRNIVETHLATFGTRVLSTTAPFNSIDTQRLRTNSGCGMATPIGCAA